jgi:hypothetical protein
MAATAKFGSVSAREPTHLVGFRTTGAQTFYADDGRQLLLVFKHTGTTSRIVLEREQLADLRLLLGNAEAELAKRARAVSPTDTGKHS